MQRAEILDETRFARQLDVLPPSKIREAITIVGAGAIGSFTALALSKMGFRKLTLLDPDVVQPHNLPVQFFGESDLGTPKVEASKKLLENFGKVRVKAVQRTVGRRSSLKGLTIVAVDNMDARKTIWEGLKGNIQVPLLIEARMGLEVLRVYAVRPFDPEDASFYENTLYSSQEAVREPCTARAILYTVLAAAAEISSQVKRFVVGEPFPKEICRDFATPALISR
jgi:hypothetical protein